MDELTARAQNYRFRAEELRVCAAAWLDDDARAMLERVACDYERMAEYVERGAANGQSLSDPSSA